MELLKIRALKDRVLRLQTTNYPLVFGSVKNQQVTQWKFLLLFFILLPMCLVLRALLKESFRKCSQVVKAQWSILTIKNPAYIKCPKSIIFEVEFS